MGVAAVNCNGVPCGMQVEEYDHENASGEAYKSGHDGANGKQTWSRRRNRWKLAYDEAIGEVGNGEDGMVLQVDFAKDQGAIAMNRISRTEELQRRAKMDIADRLHEAPNEAGVDGGKQEDGENECEAQDREVDADECDTGGNHFPKRSPWRTLLNDRKATEAKKQQTANAFFNDSLDRWNDGL